MAANAERTTCTLCLKTKEQVRKLIVGLRGAVCSDCIELCVDILAGPRQAPDEQHPEWDGSMILDSELRKFYLSPTQAKTALRAYQLHCADWNREPVSRDEAKN